MISEGWTLLPAPAGAAWFASVIVNMVETDAGRREQRARHDRSYYATDDAVIALPVAAVAVLAWEDGRGELAGARASILIGMTGDLLDWEGEERTDSGSHHTFNGVGPTRQAAIDEALRYADNFVTWGETA
jgi:hypothetical protein